MSAYEKKSPIETLLDYVRFDENLQRNPYVIELLEQSDAELAQLRVELDELKLRDAAFTKYYQTLAKQRR